MNPEQFLRAFHASAPGATSQALGRARTDGGLSSYQVLAQLARPGQSIIDLGCGDGHLLALLIEAGHQAGDLVGVDISTDELEVARKRPGIEQVTWINGNARSMPMGDGSADLVLSHLAFMLMEEIEEVVAEIARVLRPGGGFATIVGGGPVHQDAFELFLNLAQTYARDAEPTPRLGDSRTREANGFASLLGPHSGFSNDVFETRMVLDLGGSVTEVWQTLSSSYELFTLSPEQKQHLAADFHGRAHALLDANQRLPCAMVVRLLRATRS